MDNKKLVSSQLDSLFTGLESGLISIREVRAIYEEEVAFDFNPLQFFWVGENVVTEMLAYFLNPVANHGQKDRLLKVFLRHIDATIALNHLDRIDSRVKVKVQTQCYTDAHRPVDSIIIFGDNEYIIGIENKVWGAPDQPDQLTDYINYIKTLTNNNFIMLYLSPHGESPSSSSISQSALEMYKNAGQFKIVPFCGNKGECSILTLLQVISDATRADSVRTFIRFMIKYFERCFIGGVTMDEQVFVVDYLKKHSTFFAYVPALSAGYGAIKQQISEALNQITQLRLKEKKVCASAWPAEAKDDTILFDDSHLPLNIYYSIIDNCIGLYFNSKIDIHNVDGLHSGLKAHNISLEMFARFMKTMTDKYKIRSAGICLKWLLIVPLPSPEIGDKLMAEVLEEENIEYLASKSLCNKAEQLADFVLQFIWYVEAEWLKAGLPVRTSGANQ